MLKITKDNKSFMCDLMDYNEESNSYLISRGIGYKKHIKGDFRCEYIETSVAILGNVLRWFDLIDNKYARRIENGYVYEFFNHGLLSNESIYKIRNDIRDRFGIAPHGGIGNKLYDNYLLPYTEISGGDIFVGFYSADSSKTLFKCELFDLCFSLKEFNYYKDKISNICT